MTGIIYKDRQSHPLRDILITAPKAFFANRARSRQTVIGPSEIGNPCTRCLARKLNDEEEPPGGNDGWKAEVGTLIHDAYENQYMQHWKDFPQQQWYQDILSQWNLAPDTHDRWAGLYTPQFKLETRIELPPIGGRIVRGTCDVYEATTGTVIDYKTTSTSQLKARASHGHKEVYQVQAQLYGLGYALTGETVHSVMFLSLPRDGELKDSVLEEVPFTPRIALNAIDRANALVEALRGFGPNDDAGAAHDRSAWIRTLPTDSHCFSCGRFEPSLRHGYYR